MTVLSRTWETGVLQHASGDVIAMTTNGQLLLLAAREHGIPLRTLKSLDRVGP
jgi:hypothetical protein